MQQIASAPTHVVIVGGGITGLSAAWYLRRTAGAVKITVLEQSDHWGGKVISDTLTTDAGEFIIDGGPESFVTRKREVWDLVHELGIEQRIIPSGNETKNIYVLDNGKPVAIPMSPVAFVRSPLLSWGGKLRMLREPLVPSRLDDEDESLAQFASRRLGREALEKFIGPVLGGIYNTNPEEQSILVTSPVMREMEREHGGLFRGALAKMRAGRRAKQQGQTSPPRFIAFASGAQELVDALVDQLDADLRLNSGVRAISRVDDQYELTLANGEPLLADQVLFATTANVTAALLDKLAPEAARELNAIRHNSIGTISLAYHAADAETAQTIRGLMIPRREGRRIDAATWTTAKLQNRAPQGYALVRVFFGGGDPSTVEMADAELLRVVRDELRELVGITAEPVAYQAYRWQHRYPQADVGHLARVDRIEAALPAGLHVSGSSYRGLAVPDCVRQAKASAEGIVRQAALIAAPA